MPDFFDTSGIFGPILSSEEEMAERVKKTIMKLKPGDTIRFERHDPEVEPDGRWFTVSVPVEQMERNAQSQ